MHKAIMSSPMSLPSCLNSTLAASWRGSLNLQLCSVKSQVADSKGPIPGPFALLRMFKKYAQDVTMDPRAMNYQSKSVSTVLSAVELHNRP